MIGVGLFILFIALGFSISPLWFIGNAVLILLWIAVDEHDRRNRRYRRYP